MNETNKKKRPTQHEAGGAGRRAGRGNLQTQGIATSWELRSPAQASSGPLAGHGVVVLGEGMMGRSIGLASVWEAGTAMLSAGNY